MTRAKNERLCLGVVLGAHGVRGLVRVKTFTRDPSGVAAYEPVETADGKKRFKIEALNLVKDAVLCRLEGITDRDQAEALRGTELYVSRDQLPTMQDTGEWYYADLIGLTARDKDGKDLGEIIAVDNFGAGDLLEIKLTQDGESHFLSFTEANVPGVDVAGGFVVIDPPIGGLEEGERDE